MGSNVLFKVGVRDSSKGLIGNHDVAEAMVPSSRQLFRNQKGMVILFGPFKLQFKPSKIAQHLKVTI